MVRDRSNRARLVWGVVLLIAGAFALALNLGFRIPREFWDYSWNFWPVLFIVAGIAQLAVTGVRGQRPSGFILIGIGVYGAVSQFELFGLNWGTAWPILLVSIGVRMVLRSLVRPQPQNPNSTPGSQS